MDAEVHRLLRIVHTTVDRPIVAGDEKRAAEARLDAFARSPDGLQWAVACLGQPGTDGHTLFFAATVLERVVAYRWQTLPHTQQLALTQCLWQGITSPAAPRPRFITRKLAAALGHLTALGWQFQEFWQAVQDCLTDGARVEPGLILIDATMEQLHTLSQASQAGLRGKVLSEQLPAIKERLAQAQPLAMSLLFSAATKPDSACQTVALRSYALHVFQKVLSEAPGLGASPGQALELVSALASIVQEGLCANDTTARDIVLPALGCLTDILGKVRGTPALQHIVHQVCGAMEGVAAWLPVGMAGGGDTDFKVAYLRLIVQYLSVLLGCGTLIGGVGVAVQQILHAAEQVVANTRSALDLLMMGEIWHAVLEHLEQLESEVWLPEGGLPTTDSTDALLAHLKRSTCGTITTLLSTLFSSSAAGVAITQLDTERGSGAELEDCMLALAAGSDAEDAELAAVAAVDDGQHLTGGGYSSTRGSYGGVPDDCELGVYLRYAEALATRALSMYTPLLSPAVVSGFAGLERELVHHTGGANPVTPHLLWCLVKMDMALKLLGRCGPSVTTTAAAELVEAREGQEGQGMLQRVLTLTACWLRLAQNIAGSPSGLDLAAQFAMSVMQLGRQLYASLAALTASWIPTALLSRDIINAAAQETVAAVAIQELGGAAAVLDAFLNPPLVAARGAVAPVAVAAAQHLLSLTSIGLSSGMKPPQEVLGAIVQCPGYQSLVHTAACALYDPGCLPSPATRALWVSLSDLSLRSWASGLTTDAVLQHRTTHFTSVMAPLMASFPAVAQQLQAHGGTACNAAPTPIQTLTLAAGTLTEVVQSYSGSKKAVRGIVYSVLIAPVLPHILLILPSLRVNHLSKEGSAAIVVLLRTVSVALEVLSTEMPTAEVEHLFRRLFGAFLDRSTRGAAALHAGFQAEVQLASLLLTLLSRGGGRHAELVSPALQFCVECWGRCGAMGSDAELVHAKTHFLAVALSLLRHHWRHLTPNTEQDGAAIMQVLNMLRDYLTAAGTGVAILPAADLRAVLEELYDLAVAVKLYAHPMFQPHKAAVAEALLLILLSRLHTGAQEGVSDTLYAIAASNWSDFLLTFVPAFSERQLAVLGPAKVAVVGALGVGDMGGAEWDTRLLAFLNDAWYYQQAV